jgi:hypothetical protein
MTATGIEALTVSPTFKTRYSEEAPKMTPSTVPIRTARSVNSGTVLSGGTTGAEVEFGVKVRSSWPAMVGGIDTPSQRHPATGFAVVLLK